MPGSKNLLLITLSFPYDVGKEDTFLKNEVPFYSGSFNKVIILPCQKSETKVLIDSSIIIDNSLSDFNEEKKKTTLLPWRIIESAGVFFIEFIENLKTTITLKGFRKLLCSYISVCRYLIFFKAFFRNIREDEWTIYTYWFTPVTTAASVFASDKMNIKVVTRAHGIDLYEFRNNNYIPFRKKSIELLYKYFFVSDFGKQYTQQLYPQFMEKLEVFPLAVRDTEVVAMPEEAGCLSIVSCSSVDYNKRVHYILHAIQKLALKRNDLKFIWNHFGGGFLLEKLTEDAGKKLLANFEYHFHGYVENDFLVKFYAENRIDVFITTTASEGGRPISIMEALCCHIPVIATKVGGIPEIVNDSNGSLINENPSIEEISDALMWFADNKTNGLIKRKAARQTWQQKCDPNFNFSTFVKHLASS